MSNINKDLLILERSSSSLDLKSDNGVYILEGIFGELDKKNKNNRIYTAEEYLPQIESLQDKIKASKLLGELDHPSNFDVSLKNVSHIIEEITYDEANKLIRGRIRLLDTEAGRQAKALVDAGVPLQISSRAAGAVEENGKVKIKQLFTYDLVADPGFENAELTRVNESYGFESNSDLLIYEIQGKTQTKLTKENKESETMAESKFITVEDFNKYSKYLSEEIKTIKESLAESIESKDGKELKEYATYLAERLDQSIKYSEHIAEKTDQSIQYSEELAEKIDQSIQYSESIAEKTDQSIQYSEHLAEGIDKIKEYTNYLAESYNEGATSHDNLLEYIEYLKENLEKVTEYTEYVAETVNTNLVLEDGAGIPAEDLETGTEDVTADIVDADGNVIDGKVKNVEGDLDLEGEGDAEGAEIKEGADGAGTPAEDLETGTEDVTTPIVDADGNVIDGKVKNVEGDLDLEGEGDAEGTEIKEDRAEDIEDELKKLGEPTDATNEETDSLDAYKNSITEKLQLLINKAEEKKTKDPHFFRFVSESSRSEFNELVTEDKSKVLSAIEGRGFLTEGQILGLWKNSLLVSTAQDEPKVTALMPSEYKETYSKLSEAKKNQILAQSRYHTLETSYQVANFWQTRDLRDTAVVMEKVELIKESKEVKPSIGYDTTAIAAEIAKRFKK
jgi:methyl-accepting chemotaxis protein